MNAYEDELFELCTDYPEEYKKLKAQLENKKYDVQGADHNGQTPPEPPKDKDGKPLPPPNGFQHGQQQNK